MADSGDGGGAAAGGRDPSDLLCRAWRPPAGNATPASDIDEPGEPGGPALPRAIRAQVLWGHWTSHMQFFDRRLREDHLINGVMGLEQDTLGTPHALARSHQRCVRRWGMRACNFSSTQLVLHSHRDVGSLDGHAYGDVGELRDLETWRRMTAGGRSSVWLAKRASSRRSPYHRRASMFDGRQLVVASEPLPAGMWVVTPWPKTPLRWRHHRFLLRTWLVLTSVQPLRLYILQDAWAHVVARPYTAEELLDNYKDRCVHLWTIRGCSVTHAHRVIRSNHEGFAEGLVGLPPTAVLDPAGFWRRRAWPALEDAAVRAVLSVGSDLLRYERALRSAGRGYRRVATLALDWQVDEGGVPVLFDVDVDGVGASDELPMSRRYAADALRLAGVAPFPRDGYASQLERSVAGFCSHQPCDAATTSELRALVDEAHHAGSFARVFPPTGSGGCAPYCHFFQPPPAPAGVGLLPSTSTAGGGGARTWPPAEDQLTWAFLKAHQHTLPHRARLPPVKRKPPAKQHGHGGQSKKAGS